MNQEELRNKIIYRRLAPAESLCVRTLDIEEIKKMDSLVYRFHELFNTENLQAAIDKPKQIAAGRDQLQKNRAREFWTATDDKSKQQRLDIAIDVANQFQELFPQFVSTGTQADENTAAIVKLIKERQESFSLGSVIRAYQTLCSQGLIWVCPEQCGLEGSEALEGRCCRAFGNGSVSWSQLSAQLIPSASSRESEIFLLTIIVMSF